MATVLIRFDGGNVPVVTGATPLDKDTPTPYEPLWQVVQAVDGVPANISFRRTKP